MEYIIRPRSNTVEYDTPRGIYKGKHKARYIVKYISVVLTADDPTDLMLMCKHRKPIEQAIVETLNHNVGRLKK